MNSFIKALILKVSGSKESWHLNADYSTWYKKNFPSKRVVAQQTKLSEDFRFKPKISIITPVFNTPIHFLMECIESVIHQSYDNWELCIVDDSSTNEQVRLTIKEYAMKDKRIKFAFRKKNGHICRASNDALKLTTGKFVGILDHDDVLWPNALFEVVACLNQNRKCKFIYTDEEKLSEDGKTHQDPFFKPDWSPDYLRSLNYITHFAVIKKTLIRKIGNFKIGLEGAQDWDFFLRTTREVEKKTKPRDIQKVIYHIPTVLYSWRMSKSSTASRKHVTDIKKYAFDNQSKVLAEDLQERRLKGEIIPSKYLGIWNISYKIEKKPMLSIIVPTKNNYGYLTKCIDSITKKSTYSYYEIIIVDTGSTDHRLHEYYKHLGERIKVINYKKNKVFNFSLVCNYAVAISRGEYLMFLNDDTQIISPDWIQELLGHAQRKEIGAVGCKLIYPNGKIQHAGICLGYKNNNSKYLLPGHIMKGLYDGTPRATMMTMKDSAKNYLAVTGAALMIKKSKFLSVRGFDPAFRIAYNDVDLCLKLIKKNYLNLYTPKAILYHHESISVGRLGNSGRNRELFSNETEKLNKKWHVYFLHDPYFNINLDRASEKISLKTI